MWITSREINDTLGHTIGDQLLKSVAQRLVACVRHSDTVSRQGGDEFPSLPSEMSRAHDAAVTADKILAALSVPHRFEYQDVHLTASVGEDEWPQAAMDT